MGLGEFYPWENMETLQMLQVNRDTDLLRRIKDEVL